MYYVEFLISIVFAIDVLLGFRRAFLKKKTGEHVTDPVIITKKYLKFYFWIDLVSCIPFDMFVDNYILRYASLLKIIRLFRFKKIIQFIGVNDEMRSKISVVSLIIANVTIIHWVTCIVYHVVNKNWQGIRDKINQPN